MNGPNFFIIGAAKCGTTSLHYYLAQHPEIFLTKVKEPHFFDNDNEYVKGYDYYLDRYYKGSETYKIRGEATPNYLHQGEKVAGRILQDVGSDLKFVVLLRDPVQRAYSHYQHMVRNGLEQRDFNSALDVDKSRSEIDGWYTYYLDGFYYNQLQSWVETFGRERFLFLLSDELSGSPAASLSQIYDFLGVDRDFQISNLSRKNTQGQSRSKLLMKILNTQNPIKAIAKAIVPKSRRRNIETFIRKLNTRRIESNDKISADIAATLKQAYRNDILQLEELVSKDLSSWHD